MRIKTGLSLLAMLFLGLALVFTGCAEQGVDVGSTGGSLALNIQADMSKTVVPDLDMTVATYDIVGTGPSGANFAVSNHATSAVAVNNLAVGAWSVVAYARNPVGTLIAMGSAAVTVNAGLTTSASITVIPLLGNGTLSINVSWSGLASPSLEGTLTPAGGSASTLTGITYGVGSASYTDSSLAAGYYTLSLVLKNDGTPVWGATVAVRILAGETTSATHDVGSVSGTINLSINQDLQNPIAVTLSGVQTSLLSGTDMTVVATPAEAVDSYAWYLDGVLLGETTAVLTIGAALSDGNHRLDVIVTKGVILSSTNANFTVGGTPPASIKKVYSERTEGTDIVLDTVWEVWDATVTTFNELSATGADGGIKVIQVVPNTSGPGWFGFVIKSDSKAEDLTGYNYLIVNLKTTDIINTSVEVGVGQTNNQHWFSVDMNGKTDGLWHKFVIDVSAADLSAVDWVFAMRNGTYTSGTVEFDDIHYSTVDPGDGETVTPPASTIKTVYSEIAGGLPIPMDPSWQVWSGTITTFSVLTETGADGGTKVIHSVPNPGIGWFGFTIRTQSHAEDLSGYNYLVFSLRSTDMNSTGIEIGVGTPDLVPSEEFWFSANMVGKIDGNWHQFVIDLGAAGVNLASIDWMFAMRNGSYVGGNIDFDNVYFTTTAP